MAASGVDKAKLQQSVIPNIGIVTSYNDMLSAHRPYEPFPEVIRAAARVAGATAQVAGGVPAMCDGVTQGRAGMELSLFSRDVIALATAVALSHEAFDGALLLGICDKIVPGPVHRRGLVRPDAHHFRARRAHALRHRQQGRRPKCASGTPKAWPRATNCWPPRWVRTTTPAPARSTARPIPTRC